MAQANGSWIKVARADELMSSLSMKRVELPDKEIVIINVDGGYYALGDRCGHMNAPLSRGKITTNQEKHIVTCPLHGSTFDVATGKNLSGPVKPAPTDMSTVPRALQDQLARAAELSAVIKVHNVESFEVERRGDDILVRIPSEAR
jgi:nitrite reductase/ring-hydroxylating ferredoxin subunit